MIYEDHRLADKSFGLLPIEVNNQLMLTAPLDHNLVAQSPESLPLDASKAVSTNETLSILDYELRSDGSFYSRETTRRGNRDKEPSARSCGEQGNTCCCKEAKPQLYVKREEFLWEIGADVEIATRELEEEPKKVTQKWRRITRRAVDIIMITVSAIFGEGAVKKEAVRALTSRNQFWADPMVRFRGPLPMKNARSIACFTLIVGSNSFPFR